MVGQINRRRVKKRKRPNENSKMKFTVFLVIMIVAVALGYLTARFVIGPLLGYYADESPIKIANGGDSKDEEASGEEGSAGETEQQSEASQEDASGADVSAAPEEGYALQFGVFTSKEAAEKLASDLKSKGIETKIIEEDSNYKVISPVVNTKDEAIDELNGIKDKEVEDVFIASF